MPSQATTAVSYVWRTMQTSCQLSTSSDAFVLSRNLSHRANYLQCWRQICCYLNFWWPQFSAHLRSNLAHSELKSEPSTVCRTVIAKDNSWWHSSQRIEISMTACKISVWSGTIMWSWTVNCDSQLIWHSLWLSTIYLFLLSHTFDSLEGVRPIPLVHTGNFELSPLEERQTIASSAQSTVRNLPLHFILKDVWQLPRGRPPLTYIARTAKPPHCFT